MKPIPPLNPSNRTELLRIVCRQSFEHFVRYFWHLIPGAEPLQWNWHLSVICKELQEVAERVFAGQPATHDVIINISPGTSKSSICSILFHPWTWTRMPQARHLTASHTESLVLDLAAKARAVILSEQYQECYPEIELVHDQTAKGYFRNTSGGDRYACTVGGKSPMGFHGHFLSSDDLINPQQVASEADLKTAKEFVLNGLPTRMVNKLVTPMIMVMQRLGRGDPTDVMLENSRKEGARPVRHYRIPCDNTWEIQPSELSIYYAANKDGLMDPTRLPRIVLNAYKARGEFFYAGQFGQSPKPLGGGMFKDFYFNQRIKSAPFQAKRIRFWDRASTDQGGCFTAGVLMAMDAESFFIEHLVHGQWEPNERNNRILATAQRDRFKYGPKHEPLIYVEAEGGSSGRDAWKGLARKLAGFRVKEYSVVGQGDKDVRAEPWSDQLAAKNVYVVDNGESQGTGKADWDVQRLIDEHLNFRPEPGKKLGRYKDIVDSCSASFNLLVNSRRTTGTMRIITAGKANKGILRLVVCSREELPSVLIDTHPTLFVSLQDYSPEPVPDDLPPLGISRLLGTLTLRFTDIQPVDYQDQWQEVIPAYGKPPAELVMSREDGKRLWAFLLKKRDIRPEVWVFQDEGEGKAISVAMAVADTLGIPRSQAIYSISDPNDTNGGKPPLAHIYDTVKATRHLIAG